MYGEELAKKLEAILASGATPKAVAKEAGCDISTVYRIRSGAIVNPSYSVGRSLDEMYAKLRSHAA
ncbi:helix-turn-helix domain-containing protein [Halomonas elongata]|uniref:Helix-turn-helix domain-containing protein n=1 Tax=Halomonas elongata (strain ATCC 33173 / DSM 2581 / NBRC 15536 / NCIMB 2198 / 1H9) TaxID=768066 RepID=A0ABZ0TBE4_HALED|nr:helix-turn-helix domain-containing protein [Halomonas elongata]WBF19240.1 helix-turn-helix domain-containing protein [Halomonas elongata]WPU48100.1 helix-turn-helix domain-containing protein [Halomonas elongata DSM 2581]